MKITQNTTANAVMIDSALVNATSKIDCINNAYIMRYHLPEWGADSLYSLCLVLV